MKNILLGTIIATTAFLCSCNKEDDPKPVMGCTIPSATNYNAAATQNDGSCQFSTITFYGAYGYYSGVPISGVSVSVNGDPIGNLSAIYPNGPGNCSAPGTVHYDFRDGNAVDWNGTIYLANGVILYSAGTVSPYNTSCIKVNVTR